MNINDGFLKNFDIDNSFTRRLYNFHSILSIELFRYLKCRVSRNVLSNISHWFNSTQILFEKDRIEIFLNLFQNEKKNRFFTSG